MNRLNGRGVSEKKRRGEGISKGEAAGMKAQRQEN